MTPYLFENLPTNLKIQIQDTITAYPPSEDVFAALITHLSSIQDDTNSTDSYTKKRKITNSNSPSSNTTTDSKLTSTSSTTTTTLSKNNNTTSNNIDNFDDSEYPENLKDAHLILQIPDLSIQSPIRKKLNLIFCVLPNNKNKIVLCLTKSIDNKPELILNNLNNNNIKFSIFLNVPEKKNLNYFLIYYISNLGNKFKNDPIIIQFNNDLLTEQFGPLLENPKLDLISYLINQFKSMGFNSLNSTKNNEKSFFVESYKGSKEGVLYFLPNHIIFGFKKPILIFNSKDIDSITYSSITRLTFNVTLHVKDTENDDINNTTENNNNNNNLKIFEFSMIDQKEFEKIDKYVKNKEFRDKSMTEELKAKSQLKNKELPGALAEAARQIPGGDQIVGDGSNNESNNVSNANGDSDDEDFDASYQVGDDNDDESGGSGDEDEDADGEDADEDGSEDDDDDDDEEDDEGEDEDEDEDIEGGEDDDIEEENLQLQMDNNNNNSDLNLQFLGDDYEESYD